MACSMVSPVTTMTPSSMIASAARATWERDSSSTGAARAATRLNAENFVISYVLSTVFVRRLVVGVLASDAGSASPAGKLVMSSDRCSLKMIGTGVSPRAPVFFGMRK